MMTISLDRILTEYCFPAAVLWAFMLCSYIKTLLKVLFLWTFALLLVYILYATDGVIFCMTCLLTFDKSIHMHTYHQLFTNNLLFLHASNANKKWLWSALFNLSWVYATKCTRQFRSLVFLAMFLFLQKPFYQPHTSHITNVLNLLCRKVKWKDDDNDGGRSSLVRTILQIIMVQQPALFRLLHYF